MESPTRSERDGEGGGEYTPPPLPPIEIPEGHTLSRALAEEIRGLLPPRLQLHHVWTLVYSLELHGVSLGTLYKKARESRGAYVLVVKDSIGGVGAAFSVAWRDADAVQVFGAFVNEPLRPSGRYYGSGECFLWKAAMLPPPAKGSTPEPEEELGPQHAEMIRFKAFPYSGMNDYVILCDSHFLSVGGG